MGMCTLYAHVNQHVTDRCFQSCDIDNPQRAEFWNPANLGYRFLAEARRLWELEAGTPKLTTIQAAMIFNPVYNMNGSDELGYKYNTMGIAMANELRLFDPCPMASQREQDARDFTAWWLYGFQG